MGVPKFFRWISERYPCLSELVKEYQIPEFDNLYLDMNGIIHMCSHPNDFDPHFRITEEKIFKDIFHYIEILFRMIQPRKLFFMAVDGVAPRAKMNQQRGRRFRSAKEAEILEQKAKERGEALPSEARFDSNCITPGTEFMARLQEQLKYFVTYKMSSDSQWRDVKVILSGHETPGEGEHKIMDYIRYMKAQPGYDPNTRHCLYGLDADLIMLGLCSHEPHFSLLREEVKYGRKAKQTRTSTPEETRFFLLHLSLMREYLELEFVALKNSLSFPFDVEKIIDDWVLMGFLVGNDFIPPLPDMHIINGALPTLYKAYIDVLPTLGGYINEAGTLNLDRFRKYMEKLSAFDVEQFRETYADLKYFQAKTGRRMGGKERHSYKNSGGKDSDDLEDEIKPVKNPELAALIQNTDKELMGDEDDGDDDDDDDDSYESIDEDEDSAMFYMEFHQHKKDYYMNKLEYTTVNSEVLTSQADGYVRAIQWNLHYYYNGVCSWSWFYPHHYAPYISDICKFSKDLELKFDMGKPFLPFQQLLAVLPAASKKLLPKPYQQLMIEENSPIFHYYPSDFKTDLNGKKQEWEAVVLIPFIDEVSLLDAMAPCDALLTEEEKQRNSHGPMHIYTYTEEDLGVYQPPEHFPPVKQNRAAVVRVSREEIHVEPSLLVKGLCPGVRLDVYFPGFPTLKHIPHKAKMSKNKVKVFEQPSMGTNMILQIVDQKKPDLSEMSKFLGQSIYVAWPHLIEARVVAVSSREIRYAISDNPNEQFHSEQMSGALVSMWNSQRRGIQEHYASRLGVEIGETIIIVHATPMIGRKYVFGQMGKITLEKQWADMPTAYALQTTVQDIAVHDKSFVQYRTLQEVFPPKSACFMLGHPHYGAMGEVVEGGGGTVKSGRVKVNMSVMPEPNLDSVRKQHQDNILAYMPGSVAAQYLGVSSHLISRITGTIYIVKGDKEASMDSSGKVNVGLNLKFNKKNEEIPGYTRKEGTLWQYSTKAVTLCHDYMQKFPELFDYLHKYTGNDVFYESDVFPSNEDKVTEIADWLKEQPYTKIERHATGSEVLDLEEVQAIEKEVDTFHQSGCRMKTVVMQVKPHLLYKPDLHIGNLPPDPEAQYRLFDRIVNVRDSYTVPLGLKGIIIGIHQAENEADIMYDVVFDKPFPGGLSVNCSDSRGYRVPRAAILNLSHGQRVEQKKTANKPTAVVQPSGNGLLPTPWNQGRPIGMTTGPQGNSAFASWNSKQQAPVPNMPNQAFFRAIQQQPQRIGNTAPPQPAFSQVPPRQANLFACPVAKVGSSAPGQVTSPPSEFQAIWSQLQKGQPSPQKQSQPQPPPVPPPSAAPGPPGNSKTLKIGGDTGTELLKKMLRISDEPTQGAQQQQKRPPQQQQQQNTKPVSVEQIFQNAARGNKEQPAYVQLLNYFQQNGLEIPRYTYTNSIDNGKVRAQVMLPDMRAITGEFMPNREQASESAARLALNQLAKEPLRKNDLHKPGTNTLPIPPQQWYHPQRQDPGVDWRRMTYHAPPPQPFMFQQFPQQQPWPRGNNMQNNPQNWRQQPRQQQQEWHGNWRQETRQEPKQESPQKQFVPLQAVKQQRNSKRQTQQPQLTDPAPSEKSNSNNRNPAPTEAAANSKPNNQVPEGGRPNSSVAKPVISRPRKPRLAANFQHNIDLQ